jgi:hypothetical protein
MLKRLLKFNREVNRTIQIKCCNDDYGIKRNWNKRRTIFRRNKETKNRQTVYVGMFINEVEIVSAGMEINGTEVSGQRFPAGKRETEKPANSIRRNVDQWDWNRFLKFTCSDISATPLWLVWIKSGGEARCSRLPHPLPRVQRTENHPQPADKLFVRRG